MSELNITVESLRRVDLITVAGRIDSSNASELDSKLQASMNNGRYRLVLELSGVNYMSSAGLRAVVSALRQCKRQGGDVRLANISSRVNEVLNLAGLTSVFQTFDDATAAVGSY